MIVWVQMYAITFISINICLGRETKVPKYDYLNDLPATSTIIGVSLTREVTLEIHGNTCTQTADRSTKHNRRMDSFV